MIITISKSISDDRQMMVSSGEFPNGLLNQPFGYLTGEMKCRINVEGNILKVSSLLNARQWE